MEEVFMALSMYLAKVFGLYFLMVSLMLMKRHKVVAKVLEDIFASPGLLMMGGAINLFSGIAVLSGHFVWGFNWQVVITLLGAFMLMRGVLWMMHPALVMSIARKVVSSHWNAMLGIIFILGVFLTAHGFLG
jgi:hypothetical protein